MKTGRPRNTTGRDFAGGLLVGLAILIFLLIAKTLPEWLAAFRSLEPVTR